MRTKKILLFLISLVIVSLSTMSLAACNSTMQNHAQINQDVNKPTGFDLNQNLEIDISKSNNENIMISVGEATVASGGSVSRTIEAIVQPASASNKLVDWSLSWQDSESEFAIDKIVTEYVTVAPINDGNSKAIVTLLNPFENETIVITVTTRDGGYTANCNVIFSGKPSTMNISCPQLGDIVEGGTYDVDEKNVNYVFSIALNNDMGYVKDTYKKYRWEIKLVNSITFNDYTVYPGGEKPNYWSGVPKTSNYFAKYTSTLGFSQSNTSSLSTSFYFLVKPDYMERLYSYHSNLPSPSPKNEDMGGDGDGYIRYQYRDKIQEIVEPEALRFEVKIRVDGLWAPEISTSFTLVVHPSVQGVSMTAPLIEF